MAEHVFYVRNVDPKVDCINLPPFLDEPPLAKKNWGHQPKNPPQEVVNICTRIAQMTAREGLTGTDLVAAFVARPTHKIAEMSNPPLLVVVVP